SGPAQPDADGSHVRVGQRALRVAPAGCDHLIQRDLRLDEIAGGGELEIDDDALRTVRVVPDVHAGRRRRRGIDPLRAQELADVVGDLVDRLAFLLPDERQMTGEHDGRGGCTVLVAAEYRNR